MLENQVLLDGFGRPLHYQLLELDPTKPIEAEEPSGEEDGFLKKMGKKLARKVMEDRLEKAEATGAIESYTLLSQGYTLVCKHRSMQPFSATSNCQHQKCTMTSGTWKDGEKWRLQQKKPCPHKRHREPRFNQNTFR